MSKVNTLSALAKSGALKGKRVFIRADLNVPFDDAGNITEDTRIRASVPGIRMALDAGAAVMVTSHLGRPKEGQLTDADSLAPVGRRLSELLGMQVPPNYGRQYGDAFAALYAEAAREDKTALVPFLLAGVADAPNADALFQADGLHPVAAAHPRILDNVWPVLQPLLTR